MSSLVRKIVWNDLVEKAEMVGAECASDMHFQVGEATGGISSGRGRDLQNQEGSISA